MACLAPVPALHEYDTAITVSKYCPASYYVAFFLGSSLDMFDLRTRSNQANECRESLTPVTSRSGRKSNSNSIDGYWWPVLP
eukprot:6479533-Amphidinium_carterae.1